MSAQASKVVFDVNTYILAVSDTTVCPMPKDLTVPPKVTINPGLLALSVVRQGISDGRYSCALFTSHHIELNILHVLHREYNWEKKDVLEYLTLIRELVEFSGGERVYPDPPRLVTDSADYEDNLILDLVLEVDADLVVSNDRALQHLSPWRGRPIIPADRFNLRAQEARRYRRPRH